MPSAVSGRAGVSAASVLRISFDGCSPGGAEATLALRSRWTLLCPCTHATALLSRCFVGLVREIHRSQDNGIIAF